METQEDRDKRKLVLKKKIYKDIYICQRVQHHKHPIIRFCLNGKCLQKKQICDLCWKEFHQDHQLDCLRIEFLYFILKINIAKLKKLVKEIERLPNQDKYVNIIAELQTQISEFQELIQYNLSDNLDKDMDIYNDMDIYKDIDSENNIKLYEKIDSLIIQARKCFNCEIQKEIIVSVINQFEQDNQVIIQNIIQIINQIYDLEDPKYLYTITKRQIEDMLELLQYNQALQKINSLLNLKTDQYLITKKYALLVILGKYQEAQELLNQPQYFKFNNFEKDALISISYHHQKQIYQNDDRYNSKLFFYVSQIQEGEVKQGLENIQKELEKNPENYTRIAFYIKYLGLYLGRVDEAIQICDYGIKQFPNCQAYYDMKFILMLFKNPNADGKIKLDDLTDENKLTYSIYLIKQIKYQEGIKMLEQIKKDSPFYLEAQGYIFIAKQLFLKQFTQNLPQNDLYLDSPVVQFMLEIKQLFYEKKYEEALESVEIKMEKIPNSLTLKLLKIGLLIHLSKFKIATSYIEDVKLQCEQILKQDSETQKLMFIDCNGLARIKKGIMLINITYVISLIGEQKYDKALEMINKLDDNQELLELTGLVIFNSGKVEKALDHFSSWQLKEQKNFKPNAYLGLIYHLQKNFNQALYYYEIALQIQHFNNQDIHYNKGIKYIYPLLALAILQRNISESKDPNIISYYEAIDIFKSIKKVRDSHLLLAIVYYYQNNFEEANNLANILISQNNFSLEAQKIKASIFYTQKQYESVIQQYQSLEIQQLRKNEISQYSKKLAQQILVISAILLEKFQLADLLIETFKEKDESMFFFFKGVMLEHQCKYYESLNNYKIFLKKDTHCVYPKLIQIAKFAQRYILQVLNQNERALEIENEIKQKYPNLELNQNHQEQIFTQFNYISYELQPITDSLYAIQLQPLGDFSSWIYLIESYDFMNIQFLEWILKKKS